MRLDLTAAPEIAITGPGADDVLRALQLTILAGQDQQPGQVLITVDDAQHLLGATPPQPAPEGLRVLATLDQALAVLAENLRARTANHPNAGHNSTGYDSAEQHPLTVLILTQPPTNPATAEHLAELPREGAGYGIAALIGGDWPTGDTLTIREDRTVTAAHGGAVEHLAGTRMYHLPQEHALALYREFPPTQPRHTPTETAHEPTTEPTRGTTTEQLAQLDDPLQQPADQDGTHHDVTPRHDTARNTAGHQPPTPPDPTPTTDPGSPHTTSTSVAAQVKAALEPTPPPRPRTRRQPNQRPNPKPNQRPSHQPPSAQSPQTPQNPHNRPPPTECCA